MGLAIPLLVALLLLEGWVRLAASPDFEIARQSLPRRYWFFSLPPRFRLGSVMPEITEKDALLFVTAHRFYLSSLPVEERTRKCAESGLRFLDIDETAPDHCAGRIHRGDPFDSTRMEIDGPCRYGYVLDVTRPGFELRGDVLRAKVRLASADFITLVRLRPHDPVTDRYIAAMEKKEKWGPSHRLTTETVNHLDIIVPPDEMDAWLSRLIDQSHDRSLLPILEKEHPRTKYRVSQMLSDPEPSHRNDAEVRECRHRGLKRRFADGKEEILLRALVRAVNRETFTREEPQ